MRTLAITQNITVDGAVEMLDDWFDPAAQDEEHLAKLRSQDESCDALLLGRETFEVFREYWPQQTEDQTGIAAQLDAVQKYVVSSQVDDPQWQNSTVVSGDLVEEVQALKRRAGGDIVATGSIRLCHALIRAQLVDEFRLFVYPVVQGRGRRLFPEGSSSAGLDLTEVDSFPGGVVYLGYAAR